ncbi:hypothetical protein PR202_gb29202 [Eleusine coracana subsp. coracana]|uniref:Uncharacterized protein n=1 Tax=Eleusine coracana subsp. coracana TaxID=191504 RepID=A0AAV5FYU3_ELECO|nr:hypothetical protein PR202_gb29202 [Eleusine coracana subsp. coracana]
MPDVSSKSGSSDKSDGTKGAEELDFDNHVRCVGLSHVIRWLSGKGEAHKATCLYSRTTLNPRVKFAPNQQSKLISAAVDGLICVFDTDGDIDEDSHLLSVMNAETSVAKVGFFGNMHQKLWCLTHIETLSIWDWNDGTREFNMEDARSMATERWNLDLHATGKTHLKPEISFDY